MHIWSSPFRLIAFVLISLLIVPAANVLTAGLPARLSWTDLPGLYRVDFLKRVAAQVLTPEGVSIDPGKVVIGKQQWLFLGDKYANTITELRRKATQQDQALGDRMKQATQAWQSYLKARGVGVFKILVGPNKTTIYPDLTADWMKAADPSAYGAFLDAAGSRYVDVRSVLAEARGHNASPLYYRTDTHWNSTGAGIAFKEFVRQVALEDPSIRWPNDDLYLLTGSSQRRGGDLSAFLLLSSAMPDEEPKVGLADLDFTTQWTDFATGKVLYAGPSVELLAEKIVAPVVVHSAGALNRKKVLWLRDSFGTALSPFMSYTFSDVLQLHWIAGLQPGRLAQLVDDWKPDLVFITVVERDARNALFAALPSPGTKADNSAFRAVVTTKQLRLNDVQLRSAPDEMRIIGPDPYVIFAMPEVGAVGRDGYMRLSLDCEGGFGGFPVQIFWATRKDPGFAEARSTRLVYRRDRPLLPLSDLGMSEVAPDITRLRVDLADPKACRTFRLSAPAIGTLP